MSVTVDHSGEPAALLPAAEYGVCVEQFTSDLLTLWGSTRGGCIDIGMLDFSEEGPAALLRSVAEVRREHLYGFDLACKIPCAVVEEQPKLLRAAGVRRAEIDQVIAPSDILERIGMEAALLKQLQIVASLQQQSVAVTWRVAVSPRAPTAILATAGLMSSLHHLMPPAGLWPRCDANAVRPLVDALEEWQRSFAPRTFTYGRGPGFVGIYDRRHAASGRVRFVTLAGAQKAVFLAAFAASSAEELAAFAEGVPAEQVERFLDNLVAAGVMCRTTGGLHQSLPTLRQMEERWVEGDSAA